MNRRSSYLPNIEIVNAPGNGFYVQVVNRWQRFALIDCKTEQEVKEAVEKLKKTWTRAQVIDRRLQGGS